MAGQPGSSRKERNGLQRPSHSNAASRLDGGAHDFGGRGSCALFLVGGSIWRHGYPPAGEWSNSREKQQETKHGTPHTVQQPAGKLSKAGRGKTGSPWQLPIYQHKKCPKGRGQRPHKSEGHLGPEHKAQRRSAKQERSWPELPWSHGQSCGWCAKKTADHVARRHKARPERAGYGGVVGPATQGVPEADWPCGRCRGHRQERAIAPLHWHNKPARRKWCPMQY